MKVEKISAEGLHHTYSVTVPAEVVENKVKEYLAAYGKDMKIAGFRVGKVPQGLIEKRYGVKAQEQALSDVLSSSTEQLVRDNNIKPVTDPTVKVVSFNLGQDLVYTYAFEATPQFDLKDFKALTFDVLDADVSDTRIEKELETIRAASERYAKIKKNRPAQKNDLVTLELTTKIDNKILLDLDKKEFALKVGQRFFFPEICDALEGAELKQELTVDHSVPPEFGSKKTTGKQARSHIRITKIEEPVEVSLDDDLAKSLNFKNFKELQEKAKEKLEIENKVLSKLLLKRRVLDALAEQYDFEVPTSLLEAEFNQIWKRLQDEVASAKSRGEVFDEDDLNEDELKAEYRTIAKRRIRLGLVVSEIGRLHNIHLTEDEIRNVLIKEASRHRGQEREVFEYYYKNPRALDRFLAPVLEDKIVDFVVSSAKIKTKQVPWETFKKEVKLVLPSVFDDEEDDAKPAPKQKEKSSAELQKKAPAKSQPSKKPAPKQGK